MSLVSEALRKARAQQLRQAAENGQLPPAVVPTPQPRRGWPLLLLVSVFSGLAGAAAVAFLWSRWLGSAPGFLPPSQPALPVAPLPAPTEVPSFRPTPAPPPQLPRQAGGDSPAPELPPPPAAPTPPTVAQVAPPAPPKGPTTQEFVLEAHLPDGVLSLDFLVYGSGRAFARINGQDVAVGDEVAGFTVEAIHEDRVVLRGASGRVVLKLR